MANKYLRDLIDKYILFFYFIILLSEYSFSENYANHFFYYYKMDFF